MLERMSTIGDLATTIVTTGNSVDVVFLHGRAMEPRTLVPFAYSLRLNARWFFPQAPIGTADFGFSWWPVDETQRASALQRGPRDLVQTRPPGRSVARRKLSELLHEVRRECSTRPLILCGFSQGGMLACDTLLLETLNVEGLIVLSACRIALDEWTPRLSALKDLPVLMCHGIEDEDLAFSAGLSLRDLLIDAGAKVQWVPFEGGHEIPLPVWRHVRRFIQGIAVSTRFSAA